MDSGMEFAHNTMLLSLWGKAVRVEFGHGSTGKRPLLHLIKTGSMGKRSREQND